MKKRKTMCFMIMLGCAAASQADVVIAHGNGGAVEARTVTVTETVLDSVTVATSNTGATTPAATGIFSVTGPAGSFTYTMRGYTDWNESAGTNALVSGNLGTYVGTLTPTNTYLNNSWGVAGGGSNPENFRINQLDETGIGEAMILEFDTTGLAAGHQLSVKSLGFLGYAGSARTDVYFYDSANNQISAAFVDYNGNDNAIAGWVGDVVVNDGDFMIIKSGISSGDTDGFNLRDLTVDVVTELPTVDFITPAIGNTNFVAGDSLFVEALATDNGGIDRVTLALNGATVGADSNAPYQWGGESEENDAGQMLKNLSEGTYTLQLIAFDNEGTSNTVSRSVTVVLPSPYETWASGYSLTNGNALMSANPDGGIYNNLFEFAFGGNPTNGADDASLTPRTITVQTNNFIYLEYRFNRRKDPASLDLTYNLEHGDYLQPESWGQYTGPLDVESVDGDFDRVTARIKIPSRISTRFFRLNINSSSVYSGPTDVGIPRNAADMDNESNPGDDGIVQLLSNGGIGNIKNESWIVFSDFLFANGASAATVAASSAGPGGTLQLRLDSYDGSLIGSVDISATGGWDTYTSFSNSLGEVNGMHDLYLVFVNEGAPATEPLFNVKSILLESGGSTVTYNETIPQLAFAARELQDAFEETEMENLQVELVIQADANSPEAFSIETVGGRIVITGTDETGAMYGGMEVAENLKLGLPISNVTRTPFVKKRGIKFNVPLDARSPSYDDAGDSANLNVRNMWDFEGFWKPYIDELARCRYNVLSLWTRHPFPQIVDLRGQYPTINSDEQNRYVYRVKDGVIQYNTKGKTIVDMYDVDDGKWEDGFLDDGTQTGQVDLSLLTRVDGDGIPVFDTIEKKINHWRQVFDYANDRGLEVGMIYWNVFTPGAVGHQKHVDGNPVGSAITQDQTNDATIEYVRYAVKQFILTYPQITAIGVIAGEHDIEKTASWSGDLAGMEEEYNSEHYVYKTYGLGLKDALADQPGRKVKFIWRAHSMDYDFMKEYFMDQYDPGNTGQVQGSIKYCIGRLYSSRTIGEQEWYRRAEEFLDDPDYDYKIWLNLRNDDLFMHRWGSSDYVREFIKNMPHEHIPGFYMGSDGYVWGRDYFTKTTGMNGQMEIDKHWYNFRLWGQLAYNNEIGEAYWIATLKHRFGLTDANAEKLFHAWEQVSEVAPEVIRSHWASSDAGLAIEGSQFGFGNSTGFIPFYKFYYNEGPHFATTYKYIPMTLGDTPASIELPSLWVPDWGQAYMANNLSVLNDPDTLTPLEVADRLDGYADQVDLVIGDLESGTVTPEFQELLWDLQSMAELGRYYADRTRCAAKYWVAREDNFSATYQSEYDEAVQHIEDAEAHWVEYARVLDLHYNPQVLARTHNLDWNKTLETRKFGGIVIQNIKAETQAIREKITWDQINDQTWTP